MKILNINTNIIVNSKCYDKCEHGHFYDEIDKNFKCKCNLEQCLLCSYVEPTKNLCISCNRSFYPKENDPLNIGTYINCYQDLEGYYLEPIDNNNYNNYIYINHVIILVNLVTKKEII